MTVLALATIAIAAAAASEQREPGEPSSASASVAILLVAVIAVVIQLPGLASESNLRASRAAARAGDYEKAVAEATDAIAAMPWAAGGVGREAWCWRPKE